jgi:hypothetical protein
MWFFVLGLILLVYALVIMLCFASIAQQVVLEHKVERSESEGKENLVAEYQSE